MRVLCGPKGQRCGASEIMPIASASSWAKFDALDSLRLKYQSNADSYSALAASRNSTGLAAMVQFGRKPGLNLFPGYGLNFSGIEVFNAAGDFFVPSGFHRLGVLVGRIEAFQQGAGKLGALLRGEGERTL